MAQHCAPQDVSVLEERLAAGTAEPLFWLADGHKWTMQTDIRERYGLITLANYEHYGTVAELLGNPRYLERIDLQPVAAADGRAAWKSAAASRAVAGRRSTRGGDGQGGAYPAAAARYAQADRFRRAPCVQPTMLNLAICRVLCRLN